MEGTGFSPCIYRRAKRLPRCRRLLYLDGKIMAGQPPVSVLGLSLLQRGLTFGSFASLTLNFFRSDDRAPRLFIGDLLFLSLQFLPRQDVR